MATKTATAPEIKAAASLTDAYAAGWESSWQDVGGATHVDFLLTLVKDGATTVEILMDLEEQGGTTGYTSCKVESGDVAKDEIVLTCSEYAATDYIAIPALVASCRRVRLRAKRTGGDSGTTLAAKISIGSVQ